MIIINLYGNCLINNDNFTQQKLLKYQKEIAKMFLRNTNRRKFLPLNSTSYTHTKKSWYFLVAPIQSSLTSGLRVVVVEVVVEKYFGHNAQIENAAVSGEAVTSRGPGGCLLYTSPSPRDGLLSRMPSSA